MPSVPENIETFVRTRLPSFEQVEIVLLLRGEPRPWSVPEVAERLATPPESTAMRLFLLASNGLVVLESGGLPRYRYAALSSEDEAMVAELDRLNREERGTLFTLTGGQARDPLRSFADAFKLRKS